MRLPINLRSIPKSSTTRQDTERKSGRYLKSMFPDWPDFGKGWWKDFVKISEFEWDDGKENVCNSQAITQLMAEMEK